AVDPPSLHDALPISAAISSAVLGGPEGGRSSGVAAAGAVAASSMPAPSASVRPPLAPVRCDNVPPGVGCRSVDRRQDLLGLTARSEEHTSELQSRFD